MAEARGSDVVVVSAWVASVVVHVLLFALMVAMPWIHQTFGTEDAPQVTTSGLREIPQPARFTMVPANAPFVQRNQAPNATAAVKPQTQTSLSDLSRVKQRELSIVGIGTGGGAFEKYGLGVGAGGPGPQFFGLGGEAKAARRIVYVVDRSGSMLGVFDDLRRELKRSINALRKSQRYHVIFYSTDPPLEAPPGKLVSAFRANKERTFEFIDQASPQGMTQPIEAMRRAFALKPDLVYFLSDGDIPEAEALKENLRTWNRRMRVRIYTIAYVSSAGRQLLEEIAREHDGAFRFVSEFDLAG